MRYYIEENDEVYEDYDEAIEACIDEDYHEDDDYFEEYVNDNYGEIEIYGRTFKAFDILNEMDSETLYDLRRNYCDDENDNDRENARDELRHANIGQRIYVQGYAIEVIADDEETGDFDGDEEFDINTLRRQIEEDNSRKLAIQMTEKAQEDDIMSLFQVIA